MKFMSNAYSIFKYCHHTDVLQPDHLLQCWGVCVCVCVVCVNEAFYIVTKLLSMILGLRPLKCLHVLGLRPRTVRQIACRRNSKACLQTKKCAFFFCFLAFANKGNHLMCFVFFLALTKDYEKRQKEAHYEQKSVIPHKNKQKKYEFFPDSETPFIFSWGSFARELCMRLWCKTQDTTTIKASEL